MKKTLKFFNRHYGHFCIWLILVSFYPTTAQYSSWRTFSTAHGLGDVEVYTIFETSTGDIWFGSRHGATRYDGTWKNFLLGNAPADNKVHAIAEDNSGRLWLGTENGVKILMDESIISGPEGLNNKQVWIIKKGSQARMWLGTSNGAFYSTLTDFSCVQCDSFRNDKIFAIEIDSSGNVWIGTEDGSIHRLNEDCQYDYEGNIGNRVTDLFIDNQGTLWAATEGNLVHCFDGSAWTIFGEDHLWKDVLAIAQDWEGKLFFGTKDKGVIQFDRSTKWGSLTTKDGLAYNTVADILEDSYRNIWFATLGGGVSRFDNTWQQIYSDSDGSFEVSSIEMDADGNLWFGTLGEGIFKYDGKIFRQDAVLAQKDSMIYAIEKASDSKIWIATNNGIYNYEGTNWIKFEKPDLPGDTYLAIFEDAAHNLWFGSLLNGVTRYNRQADKCTNFTVENGLVNRTVKVIYQDQDGVLWFATNNGISSYDGRNWRPPFFKDSAYKNIKAITGDGADNLWFGTLNNGIIKYNLKASTFDTIDTEQGLASLNVHSLHFDKPTNKLWVGTDNGLNCVTYLDQLENWQLYHQHNTLLPHEEVKTIFSVPRNNNLGEKSGSVLWFGTFNGVARYSGAAYPPKTFIKTTQTTFSTGNPIFEVYARDNISQLPEISYSHQLIPIDTLARENIIINDWSEFSFSNLIVFQGLTDGNFKLQVRARDSDGNIDPTPREHKFEIKLPKENVVRERPTEIISQFHGGSVKLYFPPNTFNTDIKVRIIKLGSLEIGPGAEPTFSGYNILAFNSANEPISPPFKKTGVITIKDSLMTQDRQKNYLAIWHHDSTSLHPWTSLGGTIDASQNTITTAFKSFGEFYVAVDSQRIGSGTVLENVECRPRLFSVNGNKLPNKTNIMFNLGNYLPVTIKIYNTAGRLIRDLIQEDLPRGQNAISWNGTNDAGEECVSGLYLICVLAGGAKQIKTVAIVNQ